MKKYFAWLLLFLFIFSESCKSPKTTTKSSARTDFDYFQFKGAKRELRAVWIATVDNIDWPSKRNLTPQQQRDEFIQLIQYLKSIGINAVFVQIRAAADAFYAKGNEPWSEWLTGQQGKAPDPLYDPTAFMIEECHKRGIEFHAWLNLNRVKHRVSKTLASNNISKLYPEWVFDYDGYKLFNFGLPAVRDYITEVTANIVRNYDVDGIHFDDYFYPYTAKGQTLKDEAAFRVYGSKFSNKDDWRRNNIDLLIKQIADAIYKQKPYVKYGVSPFGVWRNKKDDPTGSATQAGQTSYDNLYADTKKWTEKGWIDYMIPQIYFSTDFDKVPFKTLTNWWIEHTYNRHLYIGQGAYRVGSKDREKGWADPAELGNQIRFLRQSERVQGSVFFSAKSLVNNKLGHADSLKNNIYKLKAIPPAMPWKGKTAPTSPKNLEITQTANGVDIRWNAPTQNNDEVKYYIIYRFEKDKPRSADDSEAIIAFCYEGQTRALDRTTVQGKNYIYAITALDRLHNESTPALLQFTPKSNL